MPDQVLVGIWVLLWPTRDAHKDGKKGSKARLVPAALLLGSAMVARGEIGLLIIQVGYSETDYLSEAGFIIGIVSLSRLSPRLLTQFP